MPNRPLMLLLARNPEPFMDALGNAGLLDALDVAVHPIRGEPTADELARAEILVTVAAPQGLLSKIPNLRWVQATSAGVDHWLSRPDLQPDHMLCSGRGTHRVQMPENILGAIFHLTKPITEAVRGQQDSKWKRLVSTPIAGKTLGILGLGTIGQELARKAKALEMRVIGTKHTVEPLAHVDEVFPPERTGEVLKEADFAVLLLPLTDATRDSFDQTYLSQMKPDSYLLNFGRGGTVVDEDLIEAVNSGTIAGAVLDVFRTEPLPSDHPFWTTKGITVLPHIGGLHPEREKQSAELVVQNARRYLAGEPSTQLVDRVRGY